MKLFLFFVLLFALTQCGGGGGGGSSSAPVQQAPSGSPTSGNSTSAAPNTFLSVDVGAEGEYLLVVEEKDGTSLGRLSSTQSGKGVVSLTREEDGFVRVIAEKVSGGAVVRTGVAFVKAKNSAEKNVVRLTETSTLAEAMNALDGLSSLENTVNFDVLIQGLIDPVLITKAYGELQDFEKEEFSACVQIYNTISTVGLISPQ